MLNTKRTKNAKRNVKASFSISAFSGLMAISRAAAPAYIDTDGALIKPLDPPEMTERLFKLAIQTSDIVGAGLDDDQEGYAEVQFRTGPNTYPYEFEVSCYRVDDPDDAALTCEQLAGETPVGTPVVSTLPLKFGMVTATVGGFTDQYVDCYVQTDNRNGSKSKCVYAGRATVPDPPTVRCPAEGGYVAGQTFTVNGQVYTVASNPSTGTAPELDYWTTDQTRWPGLPFVCTSQVTTMSSLFAGAPFATFNEDISTWDTSAVTTMANMFYQAAQFNQDIGSWDTSGVLDMSNMFESARSFNGDISDWNVEQVTNMRAMFELTAAFNRNISGWNTSEVTNMVGTFNSATAFNQDLSPWDINDAILNTPANCAGFDVGTTTTWTEDRPNLPASCLI